MSVNHYENFPVASLLLPARLRVPVTLIYRFARAADDFADEGELPARERLALLAGFDDDLRAIAGGITPCRALLRELAPIIHEYRLPLEPFHDLLSAFSQDVTKTRYANFTEL
ncbi:MAG: squalene/phytoene synthase family protein, partial [Burkholderiales bacterium]|nr:squalene/phytoene synthase family protein [Burkholderiales bacterium]